MRKATCLRAIPRICVSMMKKVVIAMSGGVDSSVAAALLKEQGYEVIGVTMNLWPSEKEPEANSSGGCCSLAAVEDARRVAAKLDIPYYVLNFRDIFEEKVIANFISEYGAGRTPNPCIRCNQFIKFKTLLQKTRELGAEFLATGHYARIIFNEKSGCYRLERGVDSSKDQSYVLYSMTQEQLKSTLMPLGGYTKERTRKLASMLGLKVAGKPESQEICFIPDNNYRRFLKAKVPSVFKEGLIYDRQGKVVRTHSGIINYTIGQRKGLGGGAGEPHYVIDIRTEDNAVVIGPAKFLEKKGFVAADADFIWGLNEKVMAQIRYNSKPVLSTLKQLEEGRVEVIFDKPQKAVTPGQAAVFYDGDTVIGGATIESSF